MEQEENSLSSCIFTSLNPNTTTTTSLETSLIARERVACEEKTREVAMTCQQSYYSLQVASEKKELSDGGYAYI